MTSFDTLIGIASLGMEISIAGKVEEISQQGAASARAQAIINELRNEIFRFSEAAKEALVLEKANPKLTAGALQLLKVRIDGSGLNPDVFVELSDKEYVSNTNRTISDNLERIRGFISPRDRKEIDDLVVKTARLPDYEFYIDTYPTALEYRRALKRSKYTGKAVLQIQKVVFTAAIGLAVLMAGALVCVAGTSSGSLGNTMACLVAGVIVALLGSMWIRSTVAGRHKAHETVEKMESEIYLDWFDDLDREFNGDLSRIQVLLAKATTILEAFFSGSGGSAEQALDS